MATRNFVPRSGSEGQLGTITKPWDKVIAITSSFTVHSGSITGDHLTLVSGSSTSTGSFGHLIIAGNITASGTVRADAFESVTGGTAISFNDSLNVSGNVTASGDLKIDDLTASGRVSAVSFGGIFEGALSQSAQIASNISGSFVAPSSSFSTRLTAITSSISALKTNSGSFSTRVTNLKTDSGSFSTRVTNLKTDSGSFSDRVTLSEASSSAILEGNFVFTNITASGNISASGDILANGRIFEKGTSVIDHATAMSIVFGG